MSEPVDDKVGGQDLAGLAQSALLSLPFTVVLYSLDLEILLNSGSGLMTGDGVRSRNLAELFSQLALRSPDRDDLLTHCRQVVVTGKPVRLERLQYGGSSDGKLLDLYCTVLPGPDGRWSGGVLVLEDATERVALEKRLAFYERLAVVGKLAARIAHELNNPLDGILRFVNLALRVKEEGDPAQRYLEQARKGLMRMVKIVRELLEFSRSTITSFEQTSVNNMVEEALRAMESQTVAHGVRVATNLAPDLPHVRSGDLYQVFCNLIKNAVDAMPEGGTLTVTSGREGDELLIRFADTGPGVPVDIRDKVFEPFFTTKKSGEGTGLGLAISQDIVEKYGGRISLACGPVGGTTFTITVPIRNRHLPEEQSIGR